MITATILDNGDLSFKADNPSDIQDMIDNDRSYWSDMCEIFEDFSCNGSYTHFNPEHGNPFVGLTSQSCIAESMDITDDGDHEIVGRLWYCTSITELCTNLLAAGETVTYTQHKDWVA